MKIARALAVLILLAGFGLSQSTPAQNNDSQIQQEVMHQLRMLPYYSVFDDLNFSVSGTTVTLSGDVVNPSVKTDAVNSVKHIQGVTDVVDKINVLPPSPQDDQIRRAEYRAIYGEPQLSKYAYYAVQGIHIIVNSGHVTLWGVVDNAADKNVANIRANSVAGVFSVTNNLQVNGAQ